MEFRTKCIVLGLILLASPAAAQWTQVAEIPTTNIFSVFANGDTIVAGADTSVHVSTDAGLTWHHSRKPVAGVAVIDAAIVRNGRLFAGTFGQGVFISDDLGASWQAFNQGLVGGFEDTQLDVSALQVRGESLYVATEGAGVYVRRLVTGSTWSHFGNAFEPAQASNVAALALGGTRLLALAGDNGSVFRRDPGEPEWTESLLDNVSIHAGMLPQSAVWNGHGWVVGTSLGVFHSVLGQEPWTRFNPGLGGLANTALAARDREVFGAFDFVVPGDAVAAAIEHSSDDGASWQMLEILPNTFVFATAMSHSELYAGRADGLWRRDTGTVSVPPGGGPVAGVKFEIAGAQPVRDVARLRFVLAEPASAAIEVFDIAGRRAMEAIRGSWPAGTNDVAFDTRALAPGVYGVRFSSRTTQRVIRLVHTR